MVPCVSEVDLAILEYQLSEVNQAQFLSTFYIDVSRTFQSKDFELIAPITSCPDRPSNRKRRPSVSDAATVIGVDDADDVDDTMYHLTHPTACPSIHPQFSLPAALNYVNNA